MKLDFDRAAIWFLIAASPVALVGIALYRKKVIRPEIMVCVFGPLSLIVGNMVFIWKAAPALHIGLKILFIICATSLVLPFMVVGEMLRRRRQK
jgi:hypothetical protein